MKEHMSGPIDEMLEKLGNDQPRKTGVSYSSVLDRIEQAKKEQAPRSMIVAVAFLLLLTLCADALFLRSSRDRREKDNLVQEMGLMHNVSIYGGL